MADKKYKINFHLVDGTTKSVEFTVPQGERGAVGIHIGDTEPTDSDVLAWLDPDGDAPDTSSFATKADLNAKLSLSGGTLTGRLNVGNCIRIWTDSEGGNVRITPPSGSANVSGVSYWEHDAFDGNLRWYCVKTDGSLIAPVVSIEPSGLYEFGNRVITSANTENWTFELEDGSTVTKAVCIV